MISVCASFCSGAGVPRDVRSTASRLFIRKSTVPGQGEVFDTQACIVFRWSAAPAIDFGPATPLAMTFPFFCHPDRSGHFFGRAAEG